MYGLYPQAERWRIHLGLGLIILAAAPLFIPGFPGKRWLIPVLVVACPLIGTGLVPWRGVRPGVRRDR